ncbi:EF-P lysine aminoacylase GenX [Hahella sp. CCB-MM4]|uniref:EF-P lysine aminoacylase EpmA n=1 Tax=Hahella sp. (strain CCB-MM4) TaxID=1926491 RepID=UPI000B9B7939|nr:EF-P lysine aminoacylase EpmA [Hahella sp. CCB-MM4]OZG71535.1 EF-P lysine aminoacylase GenX [Hahella sp. CCB-MM4]
MNSDTSDWKPAVSREMLLKRQQFFAGIRHFFEARGVLEVDTPILSEITATDPFLDSYEVLNPSYDSALYLLTSPEHAMKRMLAAGSGPIFQITKAFRRDERGRRHNPEFSMLEWYQPGFSLQDLQLEVTDLIEFLGYQGGAESMSYREAFIGAIGLNPFVDEPSGKGAEELQLLVMASECSSMPSSDLDLESALDILMTHKVEPWLKSRGAVFVYDYPAAQAALARIETDQHGNSVARRFELYIQGIEIANAYDELVDAQEQRRRFVDDNNRRAALGKAEIPIDERLLAALEEMPASAGIALGLDRLLMVLSGCHTLQEVVPFPAGRV